MLGEMDVDRNSYNVDVGELKAAAISLRGEGVVILVGHLAHLVGPEVAIVLRCRPSVLGKRLASRGWSDRKVRENIEAEAVDAVLIESLSTAGKVYEIDTTDRPRKDIVDAVLSIINGITDKYAPGNIDWSDEVLKWY